MNRTYAILTSSEASSIDFSLVNETSSSTLRWNNDNTKTFVKWYASSTTPSFCEGKTHYTNSQILTILNDPDGEWFAEIGI